MVPERIVAAALGANSVRIARGGAVRREVAIVREAVKAEKLAAVAPAARDGLDHAVSGRAVPIAKEVGGGVVLGARGGAAGRLVEAGPVTAPESEVERAAGAVPAANGGDVAGADLECVLRKDL